jgi:transposase
MRKRKNHNAEFKAKVAIEALKGQKTVAEISQQYEIHPNQVNTWKREFLEKAYLVFEKDAPSKNGEIETGKLYEAIGQLQIENNWLKKKLV